MATLSAAIPILPVRAIAAAAAFYQGRLGFHIVHQDDGYAILVRDDVQVHLWAAQDERWRDERTDGDRGPVVSGAETFLAGTASARIQADDIDALAAEMEAQGVMHPNGPLADKPYGLREFAILDLDGNLITFFAPLT